MSLSGSAGLVTNEICSPDWRPFAHDLVSSGYPPDNPYRVPNDCWAVIEYVSVHSYKANSRGDVRFAPYIVSWLNGRRYEYHIPVTKVYTSLYGDPPVHWNTNYWVDTEWMGSEVVKIYADPGSNIYLCGWGGINYALRDFVISGHLIRCSEPFIFVFVGLLFFAGKVIK